MSRSAGRAVAAMFHCSLPPEVSVAHDAASRTRPSFAGSAFAAPGGIGLLQACHNAWVPDGCGAEWKKGPGTDALGIRTRPPQVPIIPDLPAADGIAPARPWSQRDYSASCASVAAGSAVSEVVFADSLRRGRIVPVPEAPSAVLPFGSVGRAVSSAAEPAVSGCTAFPKPPPNPF